MKIRIDQLLVDKNLVESREKAKVIILTGNVIVNDQTVLKPAVMVEEDVNVMIKNQPLKYVSRAGFKLEHALETFNVKVENLVCLDIGSSTGGFTDCLLQLKAQKVYAVDVGTNQLVWKLRVNPQVVSIEKTNFRYVEKTLFQDDISFACCDVSFISLDKILPVLSKILLPNCFAIMLIKPQFEAKRSEVKNGKINDRLIHFNVIKKIINLAIQTHFSFINLHYSPITGNKKANIEFVCLLKKTIAPVNNVDDQIIKQVINDAWKILH